MPTPAAPTPQLRPFLVIFDARPAGQIVIHPIQATDAADAAALAMGLSELQAQLHPAAAPDIRIIACENWVHRR